MPRRPRRPRHGSAGPRRRVPDPFPREPSSRDDACYNAGRIDSGRGHPAARPEGIVQTLNFARRTPPRAAICPQGGAQPRPVGLDSSPLHGELLGVERLEERARALAAEFTLARDPRRGPPRLLRRLADDARVLRVAYRTLAGDVRRGETGSPAAEWLLDNFHLVEGEIREIRRYLPTRYYLELPKLAARARAGTARVYAMAVELLRYSDARLDAQRLDRFMNAYQTVAPLSIGELWAWPSMLKLALIEHLRRLSEELLDSRAGRREADRYFAAFEKARAGARPPQLPAVLHVAFVDQLLQRMREYGAGAALLRRCLEERLDAAGATVEDAVRAEHQRQAMNHLSMGNSITSLRLCSSLDWKEYVEDVSLIEKILRRDPHGVYARMDFASRDRYRHAVESLADPSGEAQVRVALRAVESARQAAEKPGVDPRVAHVGYHLIGGGRRELEADVASHPPIAKRAKRALFANATLFYLGSIALLTGLGVAGAVAAARAASAPSWTWAWAGALALLPASEFAVSLMQRFVHWFSRPRPLPRLDLRHGVPEAARTMVIVPTLISSVEGARALVEHLEVHALGNMDPHLHFALLTDFPDAVAVRLTGEDLFLDGKKVRFRRRFPNKGARLRRLPVRNRPKEKKPGEWRKTRFGGGICSYPPEDIVIEGFGNRLRRRAADLLSSETRRVVPMTTSLLDGVDMKETLWRLHEGRLFVFEERPFRGGVGSVVVIFDEDDAAYPWKTTWLGEHGQESDMAFYATPAGETLDGPGISRCQYGGFLMTAPPGRLADVFSDPDYRGAESAKEVLLLAALDYALEPRVVYAAKSPPRTSLKRWAARLGKRIVYLPLGTLAPATARRLRTFHVLANRAVRVYAKDYIG